MIKKKSQALIIIIIIMSVLASFGLYLANLQSLYFETSPLYYYKTLKQFISDAGFGRAKELLNDRVGTPDPWRPWPQSASCSDCEKYCDATSPYNDPNDPVCKRSTCPNGCSGSFSDTNCDTCYLEEHITTPPQGREGYYRIYISGKKNSPQIKVESFLTQDLKVTQ